MSSTPTHALAPSPSSESRVSAMVAPHSHRFPRDLDLPMRFAQVDSSWYENYWLRESTPRPAGMVTRNLATMLSRVRLAFDRVALVRRAVLAIAARTRTHTLSAV